MTMSINLHSNKRKGEFRNADVTKVGHVNNFVDRLCSQAIIKPNFIHEN